MSTGSSQGSNPAATGPPYGREHFANIFAAVRDRAPITQIGPYHIEQLLGEGGMGSVYKALQLEPIKRTVAIKVIKLGMDTREVIARFESERQALALMDHPNVAKVLDAGATETGRPYFVMEFVDGEPITSFCDRQQYTVPQRLELFRQACEAVQHAHQKAIIHRDLKPSNILVTLQDGKPWVKVIDFGVAKALHQRLTEKSLFTETGQLMGTPEYMAPEQAEGTLLAVDTRTDVYSLGVVLYELLIGALPFDAKTLRSAGYNEIQRIIREVDPPRPSTRLSELGKSGQDIANSRKTQLDDLHQQLRSELEWIPLKAMRKEPAQRYSSPRELSEDIENYLAQRPLRAGPESRAYRARKFLRRNKTGVAASAAMLLLLLGGITATTWQAVRATRAETRALQERDNAKATLDFLTNDVLSGATPDNLPDAKVRDQIVSAMINPAAERVGNTFTGRPLIEASVRTAIQRVLREIGRTDLALPHAEAALALYRRELGEEHLKTIAATNNYAVALQKLGRSVEAEPLHRQALDRARQVLGPDHPESLEALNNYAFVLDALGRSVEAERLYKETLDRRQRTLGADDPNTITSLNNYAVVLRSLGRYSEAEPFAREALERSRRVLGENHPNTMKSLSAYAHLLWQLGRPADAEPLYQQLMDRRRRVLGEDHESTIQASMDYATILQVLGRPSDAEPFSSDALQRYRRVLGDDHPNTITAINNHARLMWSLGRAEESEKLMKEALDRCRRVLNDEHRDTIQTMSSYAFVVASMGRAAEGEQLARLALENAMKNPSLGHQHSATKAAAAVHAKTLDILGRRDEASKVRREFALPEPTTQPATQPASKP